MEKKLAVVIPMVPNFITVGRETFPISDFTERELREIGKEWIEKLIMHAETKRKLKYAAKP